VDDDITSEVVLHPANFFFSLKKKRSEVIVFNFCGHTRMQCILTIRYTGLREFSLINETIKFSL